MDGENEFRDAFVENALKKNKAPSLPSNFSARVMHKISLQSQVKPASFKVLKVWVIGLILGLFGVALFYPFKGASLYSFDFERLPINYIFMGICLTWIFVAWDLFLTRWLGRNP